jgi:hypothetical protein
MFNGNSGNQDSDAFSTLMGGGSSSGSSGFSEAFEFEIQPAEFTRLRTGGPGNDWLVDAVIVQANSVFKQTGKIWLPVVMQQRH